MKNDKYKTIAVHGVPMADDDGCRDWDFLDSLDELGEEEDEGNGKSDEMTGKMKQEKEMVEMAKQVIEMKRYESIEKALEALRAEGYRQVRFDIASTSNMLPNGELGIKRITVSIDDYLAGEYVDAAGQEMIICDLDDREFIAEQTGDNGVWLMPANVYDELGMAKRVYWITR